MGPRTKETDPGQPLAGERVPLARRLAIAGLCLALMAAVLAAYSNHFYNDFHFDDTHTILNNVFINRLQNIPRFFTDTTLFSSVPEARTWRPLVSTSLAIDYWLGRGLNRFYFHLSTFIWFNVQLVLMFFLFRRIMDHARPDRSNLWTALLATACYGLHPANAETVNYIIQRGDLYNTLGVVASLLWFAARPAQRKRGWYLIPAVAAYCSKAPALIYPLILLAYVFLIEQDGDRKKWGAALRATAPAFLVTAVFAVLTAEMTPGTFNAGADDPFFYRITQPWVALHYFKCFFLPTDLSADSDWTYVTSPFSAAAIAGYLFVALLLFATLRASRSRETRPIAFGLLWFLLALLPTSLLPLADVTNDHRMFFPFVGLALSVFWSLRLLLFRRPRWVYAGLAAMAAVLLAAALGTRERNRVWHTEESLWRDVTIKSPKNGRGMMNYGIIFMERREYAKALPYLERSRELRPDYPNSEVNLALDYAALGRDGEAEQHFRRGLALAPEAEEPYIHYARWLQKKGRLAEAQAQLEAALRVNEMSFAARDLLSRIYYEQGNQKAVDQLLAQTVKLAFNDETAQRYMAERNRREQALETSTPEAILNISAEYCKHGNYEGCLVMAKRAAQLRPDWAEAYANMAAAYLSMERWDEGIQAAQQALRLKPNDDTAKSNLEWALAHKPKGR